MGDGSDLTDTVTVTVADDQRVEGDEDFQVNLSNVLWNGETDGTRATLISGDSQGIGTIEDNDTATIVFNPTSSNIGEAFTTTTATIELTITPTPSVGGGAVGLDRQVDIWVNDTSVSATNGTNANDDFTYTNTKLEFMPFNGTNLATKNVTVNIRDDIVQDADQIVLSLRNQSTTLDNQVTVPGATDDHTITIVDDDTTSGPAVFDAGPSGSYRIVFNNPKVEIYFGSTLVTSGPISSLQFNGTSGADDITVDFTGGAAQYHDRRRRRGRQFGYQCQWQ